MADADPVAKVEEVPRGKTLVAAEMKGKLLPLFVAVIGVTIVTLIIMELAGGADKFRAMVEGAGLWAPLVFVLLKASTYVIAPLSGTTVKLAAGALFGVWEGMALSLAGDTLGGCLNYWIARTLGRKGIRLFAGKKALDQVDATAHRVEGWWILLGARVLLSPIYDFISYAAGLARIPFKRYLIVTVVGGIPGSLLFAFLGNATAANSRVTLIMLAVATVLFVGVGIAHLMHGRKTKTNAAQS